jgi:radical SAM superfamily enzyme YgiQ (UPF0313 family)
MMQTARGCPYKCQFCTSCHFWVKVRSFSIEWTVNEMQSLVKMGCDHITIVDDVFAINKRRLKEIGDLIRKDSLHSRARFCCNAKTDLMDEEYCDLLERLNCKDVFFGFESGNERVLSWLKNNRVTVEDNKRTIELCVRRGFKVVGNCILGSPTETEEELKDTIKFIDWAKAHGAFRVMLSVLTPFPGTPVWEEFKRRGNGGPDMNYDSLVASGQGGIGHITDIPAEKFKKLVAECYRHTHPFKWKKLRSFWNDNPWETIKMALRLGCGNWRLVLRMFKPSEI